MAKESGLGMSVSVDDSSGTLRDISNDITSLDFATPRNTQDITGVNKSAIERLLLLADFSGTLNGVFNDASNQSHDVFKTIPSSSVTRSVKIVHSGQIIDNSGEDDGGIECLLTDYPLSRSSSGEFTWAVPFALQSGDVPTWSTA